MLTIYKITSRKMATTITSNTPQKDHKNNKKRISRIRSKHAHTDTSVRRTHAHELSFWRFFSSSVMSSYSRRILFILLEACTHVRACVRACVHRALCMCVCVCVCVCWCLRVHDSIFLFCRHLAMFVCACAFASVYVLCVCVCMCVLCAHACVRLLCVRAFVRLLCVRVPGPPSKWPTPTRTACGRASRSAPQHPVRRWGCSCTETQTCHSHTRIDG